MNLFHMNKSDLLPIEKAVRENVQRHFSNVSNPKFVVAVSGGADSMCLLYILKKLGISALVSHINYQKRGADSENDAELVEQMSLEWGFECHTTTVDPPEGEGQNFQQWARDFRYDIFRQLAQEEDADGIAIAHHQNDQVETILQKMFRGAGLASWSGMQIWDGEVFRPLLNYSREQIEKYAEQNAIPFRTDESNLETNFARNFLRNEWLEQLSNFFPGWKTNVLRISDQADNYQHSLSWIADRLMDQHGIQRQAFHSLAPGVQKALILFLLKQEKPEVQISHHSLERVEELPNLQTGKEISITAGVSILRDREHYVIQGIQEEDFVAVEIEADQIEGAPMKVGNLLLTKEKFESPDFKNALYLNADKLRWPITIRRWESGDIIQPFGMEGHQAVSDHLTNRKISAAYKKQALVIESFEETICAVIFPPIKNQTSPGTISEKMKCNSDTEYCLEIKYRN